MPVQTFFLGASICTGWPDCWHACAEPCPPQHDAVRVLASNSPHLGRSSMADLTPAGSALALSPRTKGRSPFGLEQRAHAQAHLDVCLEYLSGCARSHTASLAVPVNAPFRCADRTDQGC